MTLDRWDWGSQRRLATNSPDHLRFRHSTTEPALVNALRIGSGRALTGSILVVWDYHHQYERKFRAEVANRRPLWDYFGHNVGSY